MDREDFDIVLAGGGLANGLIAYRLAQRRPDLTVAVIEAEPRLGGMHTWSFFPHEFTESQLRWIKPFVVYDWPAYEVRFPARSRRLEQPYASVTSARFDAVIRTMACIRPLHIIEGIAVHLTSESVLLADGRTITGRVVLDGRGPMESPELTFAYQKFVGQEIRLRVPHGRGVPQIMDATVDQLDGYRFMYVLPFDERTVLIEDTRYTDDAQFDRADYREGIAQYVRDQNWRIEEIVREESGVLPIALEGDIRAFWDARDQQTGVGLRGAFFHPTTGYSFADAVRLADSIARFRKRDLGRIADLVEEQSAKSWRKRAFFRMLNRMLFRAASPAERYRVLQRFYGLSDGLIGRFYAGSLRLSDMVRILSGKPPVPLAAAVRAAMPSRRAR